MLRTFSFLLPAIALFCLWRCTSNSESETLAHRGAALQQRGQLFYCELQNLGMESKYLWDSVALALQAELPQNMPAKERKNMVDIRNAGLLRMFEAYDGLPAEVQDRIDRAEQEDQQLAGRMRALSDSLRQHDRALDQFLGTVKEQQPDSLQNWQKRLVFYPCN